MGRAALLGALVYPLPAHLAGLDVTDEGFALALYQQTFRFGASPQLGIWLTTALGAGWLALIDHFGVIGTRFGAVLAIYGTIWATATLLRGFIQPRLLHTGLFLTVLV